MSDTYPGQDLDLTLLNEIADGSDEFVVESIDMFLRQTPELLQLIGNYITQGDWEKASSSAHKLKPTLGFFGMLNTQSLIEQVESECKEYNKNPDTISAKFKQAKVTLAVNMMTLTTLKAEIEANL